jgi:hypothetical protein
VLEEIYLLVKERYMPFDDPAPRPDFLPSRRWILLNSVACFAMARSQELYASDPDSWSNNYVDFFNQTPFMAAYPELFCRILVDFHNTMLLHPRDHKFVTKSALLTCYRHLLPYWLPLNEAFPIEPMMGFVAGNPISPVFKEVKEIIATVAKDQADNFALQRRIGLFFYQDDLYWKITKKRFFDPEAAYLYRARAVALPEFAQQSAGIRRELLDGLQDVCRRMNRWDEALATQTRAVETAGGSRITLARLHHRAAEFLNLPPVAAPPAIPAPPASAVPAPRAAEKPEPTDTDKAVPPQVTTTLSAEEHLALRDKVLAAAMDDLTRREDIVLAAKFLQELTRSAAAAALLEKFLADTQLADEYRLHAILELVRHYKLEKQLDDARRIAALCRPGDYKPSMPIISVVTAINNEVKSIGP